VPFVVNLSSHEPLVRVRAVNRHMAEGAGLELRVLVMEGGRLQRSRCADAAVAFETKLVHVAALEQARIRRSVRRMARHAAVGFLRCMLEDERADGLGVALPADDVLRGGTAHLAAQRRAVLVVALGATDQAFVDAMMKRPRELGLLFDVASITNLRLRSPQQVARLLGVVHGMAVKTRDIGVAVGRAAEIAMLLRILVTGQAALGHVFLRQAREADDLGGIAERVGVIASGPVARFAGSDLVAVRRRRHGGVVDLPVLRLLEVAEDGGVAAATFVGADVG
jgi:hypothetical protein